MSAPQPAASRAFFMATPQDAEAVHAFAREQERQVQMCAATQACDRAHYIRGLAALYEDRNVAVKHFQAATSAAPAGPYATSSRHWIRLLEESRSASNQDPDLMHAVERVVREVLESKPGEALSLKRQLNEREKKIDELTQQIDALKRVDQEVKDRIKPSRRPTEQPRGR
jgi:lipopolysaccharide biosynthesis protein